MMNSHKSVYYAPLDFNNRGTENVEFMLFAQGSNSENWVGSLKLGLNSYCYALPNTLV